MDDLINRMKEAPPKNEAENKTVLSFEEYTHVAEFAKFAKSLNPANSFEENIYLLHLEEMSRQPTFDVAPPIDSEVYYHLPDLLQTACNAFKTSRERDIFLTTALPILSGCFNNVWGVYDGAKVYPTLYSFVVAPAASGKGAMNYARMLADDIHNELIKNNNDPENPARKMLFIPGNSSAAAIMKHIQENNGKGIICESEADTLSGSLKADWGGFSDLLRKGFHHEPFNYSRKKNNEYFEVQSPKIAIALTGTPNQLPRLIPSNEDGLFSRFMFYGFDTPVAWRDVFADTQVNLEAHFKWLAERVHEIHIKLQKIDVEFTLTDDQRNKLNKFCKQNLAHYGNEVASSVMRTGLITFRIAMIFSILRNENMLTENCKIICDEDSYFWAYALADSYLEYAVMIYEALLKPKKKNMDEFKMKFYETLPDVVPFKRLQAIEIGNNFKLSPRTVDSYLKEFKNNGMLVLAKFGSYMKP